MGKIAAEEISKIIIEATDEQLSFDNIIKFYDEQYDIIEEITGIKILKTTIYAPQTQSTFKEEKLVENVVVDRDAEGYPLTKTAKYYVGNGGYVETIGARKAGDEWTKESEEDFALMTKMMYLLYGRARSLEFLYQRTFHDALTGVKSEVYLNMFMGNAMKNGTFYDYCSNFINIKNMKLLNSRYSSKVGDELIVDFAHELEKITGVFACVARLGGDNFLVFIHGSKEEEFLEKLKNITVNHIMPNGEEVPVKIECRVGYDYMKPGYNPSDALSHTSTALNHAKKNNYSDFLEFEEKMLVETIHLKALEESVPNALKNEEFVVYYQPKVDISNPDKFVIKGAEALVRWLKDGKMISPGEFIPLLEKNGKIEDVDFYVFERICKSIKKWELHGIAPVQVSSNFSRRHLRNPNFAEDVVAIIKKYDVDPKYLEIEITESYDIEDMEALTKFEHRMHELGVDMSVDDFGSGFSSLKMVKKIAADTIKLDKSIIDGVGFDKKDDEVIVRHIIRMIKELGKNIIAEGVEYKEQADFLRNNGCNHIQGFLFAKPMPREEFTQMLINER